MRVKRGPGGKHEPGVCGIARSPSVALGGEIHLDRKPIDRYRTDPTVSEVRDYSEALRRNPPFFQDISR